MKIIINTTNVSREEVQELKDYLERNCWDFTTDEKPEVTYELGDNTILISGRHNIIINEKVFDEELFEYKIVDREELISDLMRWISEGAKSKQMMQDDLKMLMNVPDEYIFSSINTNTYIYQGCADFNSTCEELLELSDSVN